MLTVVPEKMKWNTLICQLCFFYLSNKATGLLKRNYIKISCFTSFGILTMYDSNVSLGLIIIHWLCNSRASMLNRATSTLTILLENDKWIKSKLEMRSHLMQKNSFRKISQTITSISLKSKLHRQSNYIS